MGLWDKIKDGLTTSKVETAEDVREKADKAQADAQKWDKKADEAAAEAGTAAPEAPAPAPTEAPVTPAAPAEAPAAPAAPKKKKPQLKTYTVKSGDTLSEIGAHFGVDWHDIARINDIENPDLIFPGQVFKIPNR